MQRPVHEISPSELETFARNPAKELEAVEQTWPEFKELNDKRETFAALARIGRFLMTPEKAEGAPSAVEVFQRFDEAIAEELKPAYDGERFSQYYQAVRELYQTTAMEYADVLEKAPEGMLSVLAGIDKKRKDGILKLHQELGEHEAKFRGIVNRVLTRSEEAAGYYAEKKTAKKPNLYLGIILPDSFRAFLATKHHWKDAFTSPIHGEITHRLHWWALRTAKVIDPPKEVELFELMAHVHQRLESLKTQHAQVLKLYPPDWQDHPKLVENLILTKKIVQWGLWDMLFDRSDPQGQEVSNTADAIPFRATGLDDFRAAELLNLWFCSDDMNLLYELKSPISTAPPPLLAAYLRARFWKRTYERNFLKLRPDSYLERKLDNSTEENERINVRARALDSRVYDYSLTKEKFATNENK